jgi:hypothetical protein
MDKRLEELIQRVKTWPAAAQDEAVMALAEIDGRILDSGELTPEDQEKLAALREMVNKSIAEGGDYSDDDIEESIRSRLDAWEKSRRKSA